MAEPIYILHVEDDPDFADLARHHLAQQDVTVVIDHVSDPAAALNRIASTTVDCIISDYDRSTENGITFLERVRQEYPDLPFLLLTENGSADVASDAIKRGVTDCLQKGHDSHHLTVLSNRITNAVAQYRATQALSKSEERMSLFFEESPLGVVEWDMSFKIKRINPAAEHIFGYAAAELVGETWEQLVPPTDHTTVAAIVGQLLDDSGGYRSVNVNVRKDGEHILCEWHNRVVTDEAGNVRAVISQVQDITDRERGERDLEQTNAMLSTLFDALPVGVLAVDADERVLASNTRFFDIFDLTLTPDDAIGRDVDGLFNTISASLLGPEQLGERLDESDGTVELPLSDGRVLVCRHEPIAFTAADGHLWVFNEITERIDYEDTIKALHGVARDLTQCSTPTEIYEEAIAAAGALLDFDRAAIATESEGILHVRAMSEDVPLDEPPIMKVGEGLAGKTYERGEAMLVADAVTDETALPQSMDIHAGISVPIGNRGVFQVIDDSVGTFTEQDMELVRLLARHVEGALALLDRESELQRQNERLDSFAEIVSHDLRNPLTVAASRVELAQQECDSAHLSDVDMAHQRMEELIDNVLDLARSGRPVTEKKPISLAAIAEECWANVETANATLSVETELSISADLRIKQVLENIFRNAVEHGPDTVSIHIDTLASGSGFYIEDDGPGIPPEDREQIFDRGFSTSRDGTGFGLAIVKEIIDAHGWSIRVDDRPAGGARFEITDIDSST